jgi:mRNA interferase RelE/StbE
MIIDYSAQFVKSFHRIVKRDNKFRQKTKSALSIFQNNPEYPSLHLHKLTGDRKEQWSISISRSIRLLFQYTDDGILLTDIGTHDEVY